MYRTYMVNWTQPTHKCIPTVCMLATSAVEYRMTSRPKVQSW